MNTANITPIRARELTNQIVEGLRGLNIPTLIVDLKVNRERVPHGEKYYFITVWWKGHNYIGLGVHRESAKLVAIGANQTILREYTEDELGVLLRPRRSREEKEKQPQEVIEMLWQHRPEVLYPEAVGMVI